MAEEIANTEEQSAPEGAEGAAPATADNLLAPETAPEGETQEGKKADGDAEAEKPEGAPETYDDFKMPEGIEVDQEKMETFAPIAKELNLSQEQAQKLVDFYAEAQRKSADVQQEMWTATQEEWKTSAKSDKEFGGKEFDANVAVAKKALEVFGTPELAQALQFTGAGNHPEFIRLLYRVGKAVGDDKINLGNVRGDGPPSVAKVMYPNSNMQ